VFFFLETQSRKEVFIFKFQIFRGRFFLAKFFR